MNVDICGAEERSCELDFWSTDQESTYQKNLKEQYQYVRKWENVRITYKLNEYGFRCENFDSVPNVMFLGCSHTVGVGLPIEKTFAHIISKRLDLKNYNLAVEGGSGDTCYRLARHWIPELKPTIAVYRPPIKYRCEFKFSKNGYEQWFQFLPSQPMRKPCGINCEDFYRNYLINESNSDINYYKNLDAISNICRENHVRLVVLEEDAEGPNGPEYLARDMQHCGYDQHALWANQILSKLSIP